MAELQEAGQVRWIGVSNFTKGMIERCLAIHHVDSLQQQFSMLNRRDADLIGWCGEQGVGVVSYGPLAFGLLTGVIDADSVFPEGDWRGNDDEDDDEDEINLFSPEHLPRALDTVERLRPVADRLGITLAQLALGWNVRQPGVTSAIAGSRNPAHVRTNAEAGGLQLDDTTIAEIDRLLA
jgi:aryl-alcohol dehydrogenase-like predicted oxidoreductase